MIESTAEEVMKSLSSQKIAAIVFEWSINPDLQGFGGDSTRSRDMLPAVIIDWQACAQSFVCYSLDSSRPETQVAERELIRCMDALPKSIM